VAGVAKEIIAPRYKKFNPQFSILNSNRYLCANYGT
jgi:hypothetical protein